MRIIGAVLEEAGRGLPYRHSRPLTVGELELAPPGPDELLVRIEAAGVCHSDLSVVDGTRPRALPMLLGHEACGRVLEAGENADPSLLGRRVVLAFLPRCGRCRACKTDGRLPCEPGSSANAAGTLLSGAVRLSRRGEPIHHHLGISAFASHAVVDRRSAVAVGEDVPAEVAALLGCAVLTGGGAVVNAGRPVAGEAVVVVGLGGIGMAAVLAARALGLGPVYGVDPLATKREKARELGADGAWTPQEAVSRGLKGEVVVEASGNAAGFESAVALTAPGGRTVAVGLPAPTARSALSPLGIVAEAREIVGSYLGSAVPERDVPRFEELWRLGVLPVERLISSVVGLDEINDAMDALAQGRELRQIITFDGVR